MYRLIAPRPTIGADTKFKPELTKEKTEIPSPGDDQSASKSPFDYNVFTAGLKDLQHRVGQTYKMSTQEMMSIDNDKAVSMLVLSIPDHYRLTSWLLDDALALDVWNDMKRMYGAATEQQIFAHRANFSRLTFREDSQDLPKLIIEMEQLASHTSTSDANIRPVDLTLNLTCQVPESWESFVRFSLSKYKISEWPQIRDSMLHEWQSRQALRKAVNSQSKCKTTKIEEKATKLTTSSNVLDEKPVKTCSNCKKAGRKGYTGHTIADCFHEGGGKAGQYSSWFKNRPATSSRADSTPRKDSEKSKFFSLTTNTKSVFLLDSGASYSSVFDYELLHDVQENRPPITLEVADGSDIIVKHKGKLRVCIDGVNREIHDVLYVPQVPQNILSIYQMDNFGCVITIQNKTLSVCSPTGTLFFAVSLNLEIACTDST